MIFKDAAGLPVDQTLDGGDSSMRAGFGSVAGLFDPAICVRYEVAPGQFVRHPTQAPSNNNPLNFTRDQLTPLAAGLSMTPAGQAAVRRGFWKAVLRLGFAQNIQRDKPGSWKLPWPHTFFKDSNPLPNTYPWPTVPPSLPGTYEVDSKPFDFADPLGPAIAWHLILAGRMWYLYWFGIIGVPLVILSIYGYEESGETENTQIIAQCFVQGKWALEWFKQVCPTWKTNLEAYWSSRNEIEYAQAIEKILE